jgi:hypothetical protein
VTDRWEDPEFSWSPPELAAQLIEFTGSGALDDLSGRYNNAAADDWQALPSRPKEVTEQDLLSVRLRPDRKRDVAT